VDIVVLILISLLGLLSASFVCLIVYCYLTDLEFCKFMKYGANYYIFRNLDKKVNDYGKYERA
jgi:hypothetical protein